MDALFNFVAAFDAATLFTICTYVGAGVAGLLIGFIPNFKKKKKVKQLPPKTECKMYDIGSVDFANKHHRIHEYLTEFRVRSGCDRAIICLFHNGGHYLDGNSIKKFSASHESCKSSTTSAALSRQSIPVTLLWKKMDLIRRDSPDIQHTDKLDDGNFKAYEERNQVQSFATLPIKSGDLITGFISAEWTENSTESLPTNESEFEDMFTQYRALIQLEMQIPDANEIDPSHA
jgi:transcriptional regulator with GAF, ATPase, and Fis domain